MSKTFAPAESFGSTVRPGPARTQTAFIMEFRDLTEKPIIVSELLKSETRKMDAGMLAGIMR